MFADALYLSKVLTAATSPLQAAAESAVRPSESGVSMKVVVAHSWGSRSTGDSLRIVL